MAQTQVADLVDLSFEQLGDITVTSVSRRQEPLANAPASIFVITAEDIRRSGATSIPEVLRLAPNLQVARADTNQYAISARGFNDVLANKLLVLIDGRTVYTPLYSGVFWEAQDVLLQDVERIEVISGPGATLWGANAVNGVINIITRPARDTQGTLISGGAGNMEREGAVRYGGELENGGHYRLYGKYVNRDHSERADGTSLIDDSEHGQGGFRFDWDRAADTFTVQGDGYHGHLDQLPAARTIDGGNILGRWNRRLDGGSSLYVQGYLDTTARDHPGIFHENLDIFDVEARHELHPGARQVLIWGGGYRFARDRVGNTAALAFLPADKNMEWANLFGQDEIALREDLRLTLGAKIERNPYSGSEFLPNIRLAWNLSPDHFVWAAASRAVRAPSRIDKEAFFPGTPPYTLAGGPQFTSEVAKVYELGYRAQPLPAVSYSVTLFRHQYEQLRSIGVSPAGLVFQNDIEGHTTGVEGWVNWRVNPAWRLSGGAVVMDEDLRNRTGIADATSLQNLGNDPSHWWLLRSSLDITPRHEFDLTVRRVGELASPEVPAYTAVDARLGWKLRPDLEASLLLQNLFDPGHGEWGIATNRAEYERTFFVSVTWRP